MTLRVNIFLEECNDLSKTKIIMLSIYILRFIGNVEIVQIDHIYIFPLKGQQSKNNLFEIDKIVQRGQPILIRQSLWFIISLFLGGAHGSFGS